MRPAFANIALFILATVIPPQPMRCQDTQPPPQQISFSVASVHVSAPDTRSALTFSEDGLTERGNTLLWIVELAYNLPAENYVIALPGWAKTESYDIQAKVDEKDIPAFKGMKPEQKTVLLRSVLKSRFHLTSHTEMRTFPQYALHVAKGGPKPASHPADPEEKTAWTFEPPQYPLIAKSTLR